MGRGVVGSMIQDNAIGAIDPVTAKIKAETRSKRVNLLIKPSVYAAAKKKAENTGRSVNDVINILLEDWCARR